MAMQTKSIMKYKHESLNTNTSEQKPRNEDENWQLHMYDGILSQIIQKDIKIITKLRIL